MTTLKMFLDGERLGHGGIIKTLLFYNYIFTTSESDKYASSKSMN